MLFDGAVVYQDFAFGGLQQPHQAFQQCGFAAAARAGDGDGFARLYGEIQVFKGGAFGIAVLKAEIACFNFSRQWLCGREANLRKILLLFRLGKHDIGQTVQMQAAF